MLHDQTTVMWQLVVSSANYEEKNTTVICEEVLVICCHSFVIVCHPVCHPACTALTFLPEKLFVPGKRH